MLRCYYRAVLRPLRAVPISHNVAYRNGGAIFVQSLPGTTMILETSIFESNAVRVPEDGRTTDATILLYTGPIGFGADDDDVFVPIWRIDDGRKIHFSMQLR